MIHKETLFLCDNWPTMTEEDKEQLNMFEAQVRHLLYRYDQMQHTNAELRRQLADKEAEIAKIYERCRELEVSYANLKTARIISISDRESHETKQRLSKLVREIDKCIALLNG